MSANRLSTKIIDCITCIVPDTYIQKTKKSYVDSRARRNFGSINSELQDVQRIMVANIEEVLQRGEALSGKYSQPWLTVRTAVWYILFVLNQQFVVVSLTALYRYSSQYLHLFPQPWTQKPSICPPCPKSTAATPSTSTPAPPMLRWPLCPCSSSHSSSTCDSGGSDGHSDEDLNKTASLSLIQLHFYCVPGCLKGVLYSKCSS